MKLAWIVPIARGLLLADLPRRHRLWIRNLSIFFAGILVFSAALLHSGKWPGLALVLSFVSVWILAIVNLATRLRLIFMGPAVGIAVGVSGMVVVSSVADGMERVMKSRLVPLQGHVMVTKYGLDFEEYESVSERILEDARVIAASPFVWGPGVAIKVDSTDSAIVRAEDDPDRSEQLGLVVKGLEPSWSESMVGLHQVFGRGDLTGLHAAHLDRLPGVVLGKRLALRMGASPGDTIVITGAQSMGMGQGEASKSVPLQSLRFQVSDLLHSGLEDLDNSLALVHLSAAQGLFFGRTRVTGIEFQIKDIDDSTSIVASIDQKLNANRKNKLYRVHSWLNSANALDNIRDFRRVIQITLSSILLVSTLNLALMMAIIIRRKRKQFALMLSLGANSRQIFEIMIWVGVLIATIGCSLGIMMAGLASYFVNLSSITLALHESATSEIISAFSWSGAGMAILLVLGLTVIMIGPLLWLRLQGIRSVDMWKI